MRNRALELFIFCLTVPFFTKADLSTSILPAGVNSPQVRFGTISNLNQEYTERGTLAQTVDLRSIEFDAKRMVSYRPELQKLVSTVNSFGERYGMGSALHLGNLRVETLPDVQYTGVVFARGLNESVTVGVGIPVVRYKNQLHVWQSRNNLDVYDQLAHEIGDRDFINAVNQLRSTNIPAMFRDELRVKGYEEINNQEETFLGDLQLSTLYRVKTQVPLETLFRVNINLPTGPKYNPDNLAALNQFGYTYVEPQVIAAYPIRPRLKITGMFGTRIHLPDQITARVPRDENDLLPAAEQKETVDRVTGIKFTEAAQLSYDVNQTWGVFGFSEWSQKMQDSFSGDRNSRYDLLESGTNTESIVVAAGATFSSVESYKKNKKGIPAIVTAQISDTISGKNIERQLVHELTAVIFF
jgi:hypothetical protein